MEFLFAFILFNLIFSVIIGKPIIKKLQELKFGQIILEEGPRWHRSKQYTPTMGGFIFIIPCIVSAIISCLMLGFNNDYLILPIFSIVFGVIGFLDDYTKISKGQNLGLTAKQKLVLQLISSVIFIIILRNLGFASSALYIPFANISIEIPSLIFAAFAAFVMVGTVNSVNLTDGIDGLAASVTLVVMVFFTFVSLAQNNIAVFVFASSLVGGLLGFLVFNFNPANVFMGDTGSLFLGGAVAGIAFMLDLPLVLILVGIIYIIEALSDIIQVIYFKKTGGKRFFKMAPIHHHFEMIGYSEKKIVFLFSAVTAIMCFIAYFAVYSKF